MTSRRDCEALSALGLLPIPLHPRTKRPKGEAWQTANRENSLAKFVDGDNIGVLLGEPSAWVVDVDLDTPIARENAAHFLPKTATFGRATNRSSHYLYVCRQSRTVKYQCKPHGMLLELRSSGTQTVFPPSIHDTTGERIAWESDHDIVEITRDDLEKACARLAAFTLLEIEKSTILGLPVEITSRLSWTMEATPAIREQCFRWLGINPRETVETGATGLQRAMAYVEKMPPAISGQAGHHSIWLVAIACRRGFSLSESDTMIVLREYSSKCSPPWSERELAHKAKEAEKSPLPDGYLLVASPPAVEKWSKAVGKDLPRQDDKATICEVIKGWDLGLDEYGTPSARIDGKIIRASMLAKPIMLGVHELIGKYPSESDVKAGIAFIHAKAEVSPPLVENAKKPSLGFQIWMTPEEFAETPATPDWLVEGLIPRGTVTLISGRPGCGKTWVACGLAACLACGHSEIGNPLSPAWLNRQTTACHAFVLDAESGIFELNSRLKCLSYGYDVEANNLVSHRLLNICTMPTIRMTSILWEESLTQIAKITEKPGLVIIDSLTSMSPGVDENSSEIADGLNVLACVCKRTGLSAIVLSHTRKSAGDTTTEDVKGNTAIMGAVDQTFLVTCDNERNRTISTIRERSGEHLPRHVLQIDGKRTGLDGKPGIIKVVLGEQVVDQPKTRKARS